mgnify:CR=1 FL=1
MQVNTSCTVYRPASGKGYTRVGVYRVMWQDCKGYTVSGRGVTIAVASGTDTLKLFAPLDADIRIKDVIVRGECTEEYSSTADMTAKHDMRVVTTVDRCDFGRSHMQHLEVTGR